MRQIKNAMNNVANKEKIRKSVLEQKQGYSYFKPAIIAFVAIFVFTLTFMSINSNSKVLDSKYVVIDINPSVEIEVGENNEVISVKALNGDAVLVLQGLALEGLDVNIASKLVVDEATALGYIDETSEDNMILVSVISEDDQTELENDLEEDLESHLDEKDIVVDVVSQGINDELKDEAEVLGISNGKMMFITKIASPQLELTKEELATMSIKDINRAIKDANGEVNEEKLGEVKQEKEQRKLEHKQFVEAKKQEKVEKKYELLDEKDIDEDDQDDDEIETDNQKGKGNSNSNGKNGKGNSNNNGKNGKSNSDNKDLEDEYDEDDHEEDDDHDDESESEKENG